VYLYRCCEMDLAYVPLYGHLPIPNQHSGSLHHNYHHIKLLQSSTLLLENQSIRFFLKKIKKILITCYIQAKIVYLIYYLFYQVNWVAKEG
jgi:hypothetical protein